MRLVPLALAAPLLIGLPVALSSAGCGILKGHSTKGVGVSVSEICGWSIRDTSRWKVTFNAATYTGGDESGTATVNETATAPNGFACSGEFTFDYSYSERRQNSSGGYHTKNVKRVSPLPDVISDIRTHALRVAVPSDTPVKTDWTLPDGSQAASFAADITEAGDYCASWPGGGGSYAMSAYQDGDLIVDPNGGISHMKLGVGPLRLLYVGDAPSATGVRLKLRRSDCISDTIESAPSSSGPASASPPAVVLSASAAPSSAPR